VRTSGTGEMKVIKTHYNVGCSGMSGCTLKDASEDVSKLVHLFGTSVLVKNTLQFSGNFRKD